MDVVKVLAVNLTFLFLATACNQQKTIESVSIQAKECVGEVAENRFVDRKSTRLNSSHERRSRMPSSA